MNDEAGLEPLPWKAIGIGVAVFVVLCLVTAGAMLGISAKERKDSVINCVVAESLVSTPTGPRPVESLSAGDAVWCQSPTGERVAGRVTWTRPAQASSHLMLGFDDGSLLQVTAEHPLSTADGWTPAGDLAVGDAVDGEAGTLHLVSVDALSGSVTVCDLSVTPHANFFAAGVLVHNKSPLPPPRLQARWAREEAAADLLMTLLAAGLTPPLEDSDSAAGVLLGGELWTRTASEDGPLYVTDEIGGYFFELHFGDDSAEGLRWCVTARPNAQAGVEGDRFVVNHDGVIYSCPSYEPIDLLKHRVDCSVPPNLIPAR